MPACRARPIRGGRKGRASCGRKGARGAEKVPCRSSAPIRCLDRSRSNPAPDGCRSSADHRCTAAWRRCAQSHVYRVRDGGSKNGYGRTDPHKILINPHVAADSLTVEPDRDRFFRCAAARFGLFLLTHPRRRSHHEQTPSGAERPADQPRLQLAGIERRLYRSGCLRFLGCIHPRRDGNSG
jgi:hypothetical protein